MTAPFTFHPFVIPQTILGKRSIHFLFLFSSLHPDIWHLRLMEFAVFVFKCQAESPIGNLRQWHAICQLNVPVKIDNITTICISASDEWLL